MSLADEIERRDRTVNTGTQLVSAGKVRQHAARLDKRRQYDASDAGLRRQFSGFDDDEMSFIVPRLEQASADTIKQIIVTLLWPLFVYYLSVSTMTPRQATIVAGAVSILTGRSVGSATAMLPSSVPHWTLLTGMFLLGFVHKLKSVGMAGQWVLIDCWVLCCVLCAGSKLAIDLHSRRHSLVLPFFMGFQLNIMWHVDLDKVRLHSVGGHIASWQLFADLDQPLFAVVLVLFSLMLVVAALRWWGNAATASEQGHSSYAVAVYTVLSLAATLSVPTCWLQLVDLSLAYTLLLLLTAAVELAIGLLHHDDAGDSIMV